MFELNGHTAASEGIRFVVENRHVLVSDGDNDMLDTGNNLCGNRLLGTVADY